MISRGVCRAVVGLALVAAVSACDDNPLAENREDASYFRLNPSNAAVNVGGDIRVNANVMNRYGAALATSVTATECNSNITVAPHPDRSEYEYPETFLVTGVSVGTSCIVVRGGGITDTVTIRVVPASVAVTVADTLVASGESVPLSVFYRNTTGGAAAGVAFDTLRTTFTVRTAATGVIDRQGNFTARAPGQTWVVASFTDLGVTRRDSVSLRIVAAPFTGTVTQGTTGNPTGSIAAVTFTQGATAFDTDTQVRIFLGNDTIRTHSLLAPANQRRIVLPYGLPAGNIRYDITNIGPNQLAATGTINLPAGTPASDPFEPDNTAATPKMMVAGDTIWGSIGTGDARDMVMLTIPTDGTYRVSMGWNDGSDHDLYVRNGTNTATLLTLEGNATVNPETGTVALTAGTYFLRGDVWTHTPNGNRQSTYYMTAVRQ